MLSKTGGMAAPTDEGELLCRLTSQSFQAHRTLLLHKLPAPRTLHRLLLASSMASSLGNPLNLPNQRNQCNQRSNNNNLYLHTFNNLSTSPSTSRVSPCISLYNSLFNNLGNRFNNNPRHHHKHKRNQHNHHSPFLMEGCLRCVSLASLQCILLVGYLFPTFTLTHLALKVALVSSILSNRQLTLQVQDPAALDRLLLLIVQAVGPPWCSTRPTPLTLPDSSLRLPVRMPL